MKILRRNILGAGASFFLAPNLLTGCGGGEGGSNDSASPATLRNARTFGQFIAATYGNNAAAMSAYDHDFQDVNPQITKTPTIKLDALESLTMGGALPLMRGLHTTYDSNNSPNTASGKFTLTPDKSGERKSTFSGVDLTNGSTGSGMAQAFYGVKSMLGGRTLTDGRMYASAEVILIVEALISLGGIQYYRSILTFTGTLSNYDNRVMYNTGNFELNASYNQYNVEIITPSSITPKLGLINSYYSRTIITGS